MKRIIALIGVMLLGTLALASAASCSATELQALQGTLQNVDSVSGNITVTLKDGTTRTYTFSDVTLDQVKQALADNSLQIGDAVTVKLNHDGDVEDVESTYAELHGTIKSAGSLTTTTTTSTATTAPTTTSTISPTNIFISTITITTATGDVTLNVTADTRIIIGDEHRGSPADLKAGQTVEVKYDTTSMVALRITIEHQSGGHHGDNRDGQGEDED
jgi:hypothetical protein